MIKDGLEKRQTRRRRERDREGERGRERDHIDPIPSVRPLAQQLA